MVDYLMDSFDDFDLDGEYLLHPGGITCSRCGEDDLRWVSKTAAGIDWYLINQEGEKHICHQQSATDGFENEETT